MVALVDLIEEKVVELVDEKEIVPIPKTKRNYHREDLPTPRKTVKPLDIVQKDGPSFKVEGWKVDWQNWSFRVGFSAREGLVLNQIAIKDPTNGGKRAADRLSRLADRNGRARTPIRPRTISGRTRSTPANTASASSPTRWNSAATASATSTISMCRSPTTTACRR